MYQSFCTSRARALHHTSTPLPVSGSSSQVSRACAVHAVRDPVVLPARSRPSARAEAAVDAEVLLLPDALALRAPARTCATGGARSRPGRRAGRGPRRRPRSTAWAVSSRPALVAHRDLRQVGGLPVGAESARRDLDHLLAAGLRRARCGPPRAPRALGLRCRSTIEQRQRSPNDQRASSSPPARAGRRIIARCCRTNSSAGYRRFRSRSRAERRGRDTRPLQWSDHCSRIEVSFAVMPTGVLLRDRDVWRCGRPARGPGARTAATGPTATPCSSRTTPTPTSSASATTTT